MTASSTNAHSTCADYALTLNVYRNRRVIISNTSGVIAITQKGSASSSITGQVIITAKGESTSYTLINNGVWTTTNVTPSSTEDKTITGYGKVTVNQISGGSISTTETQPTEYNAISAPDGYHINTAAIIPSGGWLKINAGWHDNTMISLATLVPDVANIDVADGANYIRSGKTAYD